MSYHTSTGKIGLKLHISLQHLIQELLRHGNPCAQPTCSPVSFCQWQHQQNSSVGKEQKQCMIITISLCMIVVPNTRSTTQIVAMKYEKLQRVHKRLRYTNICQIMNLGSTMTRVLTYLDSLVMTLILPQRHPPFLLQKYWICNG